MILANPDLQAKPLQVFHLSTPRKSTRRGVALFEFAVTLPLMLLLSLAVIDFARISFFRFVVGDATGAAGRYAMLNPVTENSLSAWQSALEIAARESAQGSPWIDPTAIVVHPAVIQQVNTTEKRITLKVSYLFRTGFWWPGIPSQTTVSSQLTLTGL
jgi:hypothetical protein